jgi:Uma2 family endonuclease
MATVIQRRRELSNGNTPIPASAGTPASAEILDRLERFTVKQFLKMVDDGIFPASAKVELLDGLIFHKMTQNPPHSVACQLAGRLLQQLLPQGWHLRDQKPLSLPGSLPEPDLAIVRGSERQYAEHHPRAQDVGLVIEIADTTLIEDREFKSRLYARARLPLYWIINIPDSQVEVYTQPRAGKEPSYRQSRVYLVEEVFPVMLEGREIGRLTVRDVLP